MRGKTPWQVFALASVVVLGLVLGSREVIWGQGAGGGPGTDPGNTFPLAQASLHAGEYLNYAMTNIGNMVITVTITTFRADGSTVGTQTVDVAPKHIEARQVSYVEACGLACDPPPVGEAQVWSQATVSRNACLRAAR